MKPILFGVAVLAAACGSAQAGEGGGEIFALRLPGFLGTYSTGPAAPSPPREPVATPAPSYARLLPENGSMPLAQTPNSLPTGHGATRSAARRPG